MFVYAEFLNLLHSPLPEQEYKMQELPSRPLQLQRQRAQTQMAHAETPWAWWDTEDQKEPEITQMRANNFTRADGQVALRLPMHQQQQMLDSAFNNNSQNNQQQLSPFSLRIMHIRQRVQGINVVPFASRNPQTPTTPTEIMSDVDSQISQSPIAEIPMTTFNFNFNATSAESSESLDPEIPFENDLLTFLERT